MFSRHVSFTILPFDTAVEKSLALRLVLGPLPPQRPAGTQADGSLSHERLRKKLSLQARPRSSELPGQRGGG